MTEGKEHDIWVTRSPGAVHTACEALGETPLSWASVSPSVQPGGWIFNLLVGIELILQMTSFPKAHAMQVIKPRMLLPTAPPHSLLAHLPPLCPGQAYRPLRCHCPSPAFGPQVQRFFFSTHGLSCASRIMRQRKSCPPTSLITWQPQL